MVSNQKKIQHLFLRAAFGEAPDKIKLKLNTAIPTLVDELFNQSKNYRTLNFLENPVKNNPASDVKILLLILKSREQMQDLNLDWLDLMKETPAQMREKMTFFWHDHFATSTQFGWLMQVQNNTLRKYALSSFRKLLHAVAKDPAMIIYLNNQQNKKDHPNENFAREVMELFTLGEGHYTETDIKEAARAFTGWAVNRKGEFEFNKYDHDEGEKEFLGRKGNYKGEDIIDILLQEKQTAIYITTKIYKEFVNEQIDEDIVKTLAENFYANDYDITKLMKSIFTADWFYDEKNIGCKVASPVELIVRYKRMIDFDVRNENGLLNMQRVLGQVLFFPPNVAGWPGGKNWIDSSTLLIRMNLPQRIANGGGFDIRPKPQPEDAPEDEEMLKTKKNAVMYSDWKNIVNTFRNTKQDALTDAMLDALIQSPLERIDKKMIDRYINHTTDEKRIISTASIIMSLPEFQLI